ncbi:hypothetical protein COLO4_10095 [Corchorus olitorius]|uniref:Uncharacterized protein n=1 Tax=Corchorus olitorius TaxID=93759 RepID=A0A1R3KA20_9ROSI|nr:hypothetical protein COLO4_10095 [Corchorus olitorius]
MELVRALPSAEDEVNVACFHPSVGGALVYGTKVVVNSIVIQDEIKHIIKSTNMNLSAVDGECGFLAANLHANNVFREKEAYGIALTIEDKITLQQKGGCNISSSFVTPIPVALLFLHPSCSLPPSPFKCSIN